MSDGGGIAMRPFSPGPVRRSLAAHVSTVPCVHHTLAVPALNGTNSPQEMGYSLLLQLYLPLPSATISFRTKQLFNLFTFGVFIE